MDRTTTAPSVPPTHVAIGILLMTLGSLAVPLVDGIAKHLGATHSPAFVAWARYAIAALLVVAATLPTWRGSHDLRPERSDHTLSKELAANTLRTVLNVSAMVCFFFAITRIPLATAFGAFFLGPVVAALAAPLLGERLTAVRLGAAMVGLGGAWLIVKPGVDLNLGSLLAVLSGVLFGAYLVTTRIAATRTPPLDALRFQCVLGALLLTPLALLNWSWPTQDDLILIAAMGAISVVCHGLIIAAFRFAEVSVLSPLTYLELVTATLIGLLAFGELPDAPAAAGTALIVASGLAIWLIERRRA